MLVAGQPETAPLLLTCGGAGTASKVETTTAFGGTSNGDTGWLTANRHRSEGFEDQVDVSIDGDNSRIRLPRVMLPPLHGGDAGWFKLKNLKIDATTITASVAVNVINSPKVYIDRRNGRISIDGKAGHYSGQCERSATTERGAKF